jgi:hypothetical protein
MTYVDQELTVEDMLADPIVQSLMRYDGSSASDVRHTIAEVTRLRPESGTSGGAHWMPNQPTNSGPHSKAA